MDVAKRMTDLVNVTTRLISVLERENEILRERRHSELTLILDEKETIARVYQARIMGLEENPDVLDGATDEDRAHLMELAKKVDSLMAQNARLLEVAMTVSKRIVDLVAEAVKEAAPKSGAYSAKGQTAGAPHKGGNMSLSLNETL
ncbi:MAG: hypothetical protein RH946_20115 [Rhodospirillales bacterium]